MIKQLIHDPMFLAIKSKPADKSDIQVAADLLDTLKANRLTCVGMAANMIGVSKRIIAFADGANLTIMYNPEIVSKSGEYDTAEGCLSLLGEPRPVKRYKKIKVRFQDSSLAWKTGEYSGFTAQIIQHEVDHCNGILI